MGWCGSCGAEGMPPGGACPRCGARVAQELELEVRARPAPPPPNVRRKPVESLPLELAVDPRELVAERTAEGRGGPMAPMHGVPTPLGFQGTPAVGGAAASAQVTRGGPVSSRGVQPQGDDADLAVDARALAEFGDVPRSWLFAPMYAWRVLRRQRELRTAHAARQVEAEHAARVLEDALVGFAERARPVAEKQPAYAAALEDLRRAEDVLRSRDNVLAAEQDAQKARLAQVDARLGKLEEGMLEAQTAERLTAQELSAAQGALEREETKLKRAEAELAAAQKRETGGAA